VCSMYKPWCFLFMSYCSGLWTLVLLYLVERPAIKTLGLIELCTKPEGSAFSVLEYQLNDIVSAALSSLQKI
jgi:hypothetical protein